MDEDRLHGSWSPPETVQPKIICAANRCNGVIVCSARHYDARMHSTIHALAESLEWDKCEVEQGFIDQWGRYYNRQEALVVATEAGQLEGRTKTGPRDMLFSEDLY